MVPAKVEHPFRVLKRQFGYIKTRYWGLAKNRASCSACSPAQSVSGPKATDGVTGGARQKPTHSGDLRGKTAKYSEKPTVQAQNQVETAKLGR